MLQPERPQAGRGEALRRRRSAQRQRPSRRIAFRDAHRMKFGEDADGIRKGNVDLLMPAVVAHGLPDGDVALLLQQTRQRLMPTLTVRAMKLDLENVLVALPGLVEHEVVLGGRVA